MMTPSQYREITKEAKDYASKFMTVANVDVDMMQNLVHIYGEVDINSEKQFRTVLAANGENSNQYLECDRYDMDDNPISYFVGMTIQL